MKVRFSLLAAIIPFLLAACGGGGRSSTPPPPPPQFTIGGSASGLAGTGLVLQDNGGDNLSVSGNGSFTFKTQVTSGGAYSVTVFSQPSSPAQTCVVTNGSGTATANVSNVQVACTTLTHTIGGTVAALAGPGLVLQDNGGDNLSVSANGSFTFVTAIADGGVYAVTVSMQPTNPAQTCEVTNGMGTATANVTSVMVDCGHNEWTWMGGSKAANQAGTYGALGTPAAANIPGGRGGFANSWIDKAGNFWLFDGDGYDSTGTRDMLNDRWKYSNGEWTWLGGSDLVDQAGIYGTIGTPSPTNIPGGRNGGAIWTDASGNVWLFGGQGGTGGVSYFNDLWECSNGEWTWLGGSNVLNQKGTYGNLGMASASNIPGARGYSLTWTDALGKFWLFGGFGYDSAGTTQGWLNDLWKYSNGQWTWMGGSNVGNQKGIYGALGMASASNIPGARNDTVTWTDSSGNLWLFGGGGYDSAGTNGFLDDLWKYSNGEWTWMGGSNLANQAGTYGTLGMSSASNIPGARQGPVTWTDASGNVWLFGGQGYDAAGHSGFLSDLWKYSNGQWTWMSGPNSANQLGTHGTLGTANPGNIPGARWNPATWIDAQGNLWFFGGHGYDSGGTLGQLNDLWRYEP